MQTSKKVLLLLTQKVFFKSRQDFTLGVIFPPTLTLPLEGGGKGGGDFSGDFSATFRFIYRPSSTVHGKKELIPLAMDCGLWTVDGLSSFPAGIEPLDHFHNPPLLPEG